MGDNGQGKVRRLFTVAMSALLLALALGMAHAGDEKIDWNRARELHRKHQQGEQLSPDEQAYLERARKERSRRMSESGPGKPKTGLIPLTELGDGQYKGEDGGLYGGGSNVPPAGHQEAAARESARIAPLDAEGKPSPEGKIVLVSIGMSNTSQEFSRFKQVADADPLKSRRVVIVDGAQGGREASHWADPERSLKQDRPCTWSVLDERLKAAGVTPRQVQVAWMKHARARPSMLGEFPAHARRLQADIVACLNIARKRYPNLRMVYLSGRIYGGYANTPLNPEPYAYESAFAARWVIQDQIKGDPKLNYAPQRGEVEAPLVLWGPYLWGDGLTPRKADGLVWKREDLAGDGTHPSDSGRQKVAALLLEFLKTDNCSRPWFVDPAAEQESPAVEDR